MTTPAVPELLRQQIGLAYFRHTNKWFTVHRGLTAAECFREIEENEIFWPTT